MDKRGNSVDRGERRRYGRRRSQPRRVTATEGGPEARGPARPEVIDQTDRSDPADRSPVFVLIHSPLLGPTSWSLVAQELSRRGYAATVPSLLGIADAPEPQYQYALSAVRATTAMLGSPVVLVAHSAAGPLLPAIADVVAPEVDGLIFVDCDLPPPDGSVSLASERFIKQLQLLAQDDLLPRSSWFRQRVTNALIPPESPAGALVAEIPIVPLSYFMGSVPMPHAWTRRPCAYLLLNPTAHTESAIRARAHDWPVTALRGTHHLSILTNPLAVTDALLDLNRRLRIRRIPERPREEDSQISGSGRRIAERPREEDSRISGSGSGMKRADRTRRTGGVSPRPGSSASNVSPDRRARVAITATGW